MKVFLNTEKVAIYVESIFSELKLQSNISALKSIDAYRENLPERFNRALEHLRKINKEKIIIDEELLPNIILINLKKILANWTDNPTNQQKVELGNVFKRVLSLLTYIMSISSRKRPISPMFAKTVLNEIDRLKAARESVESQVVAEQNKGNDKNEKKIKELETTLSSLELRIASLQKEKYKIEEASKIEQDVSTRIKNAFSELASYTKGIDTELGILKWEYGVIVGLLLLAIIAFVVWFICFYLKILNNEIHITDLCSFIPYYLPIPLFVAFMWVLIYQKNRASRLSNMLNDKLFNIHYIEGLLIAANKLIVNTDTSVERLNEAINTMVDGYLAKLNSTKNEKEDNKILVDNDVDHILSHIEEIIKALKQ